MSYRFESVYFDDPIKIGRALDIFTPAKTTRGIAIFFVHGGGWLSGTRTCFHKIMRGFNAKGFVCASTDYSLGNDIDIWRQITDARMGYDLFLRKLEQMELPKRCVVIGSSAGAHIAGLLALTKPGECGETSEFLMELGDSQ